MVYARVCIVCDICKGSEYNTFLEGGRSLRSFGPQAHTAIPMYNLGKEPSDHNHLCIYVYERPPKPATFWNSHTRTLILDTIMKLSGTIGVTQKTMTFETHVCLILLHTLNPQERWGTHKKRWPFQPRPFADAIGLVRCSYVEVHYTINIIYPEPTKPWKIKVLAT